MLFTSIDKHVTVDEWVEFLSKHNILKFMVSLISRHKSAKAPTPNEQNHS